MLRRDARNSFEVDFRMVLAKSAGIDKYIDKNLEEPLKLYDTLIKKAVGECGKCRYWQGNDISLARTYTKSVDSLIRSYI